MRHLLYEVKLSLGFVQAPVVGLVVAGAASRGAAQIGMGNAVIQKATEQF